MNNTIFLHILLSTLAFVVLCLAALQALVVAMQEYCLRHKQAVAIIARLPPLEVMETSLFRMIKAGFVLLTIVIISSFWSFHPLSVSPLWEKTLVSLFAWVVFAGLLFGRSYFGWRGRPAIRWTLGGVFLVMLAYFGSELL